MTLRFPNLSKNMEENIELVNSPNDEEINTPEVVKEKEVGLPADEPEIEPQDEELEDIEELKSRNQELYEQLKKAKGFVRDKRGKWVKKEVYQAEQAKKEPRIAEDITRTELYSLVKANVPEEDTEEVITYAKSRGMTITEALKTPEVKAILRVREEYRQSEEATNVSPSRRGSSKISDDTLLANARKGEMPESDEDLLRLIRLRRQKK